MHERVPLRWLMEGCQIISPDYRYLFLNPVAASHGRVDAAALLGRTMMEAYPGIEATPMFERLRRCMEQRVSQSMENEFVYPDGTRAWFELRFVPVREGVAVLSEDVSPRHAAAEALRRAHRALGVARAGHRAVVAANDEAHLLAEVCKLAVEAGGYGLAWVALKGEGQGYPLCQAACAGEGAEHLRQVELTWADVPEGRGPTGCAVREGRTVVARPHDAALAHGVWRVVSRATGYGAVAALPLRVDGAVVGALTLYAEHDAFDDGEVVLLEDLGADLAFGLETLRARHQLAESEARYERLLKQAPVGIAVHAEGRLVFVNPEAERILGARVPGELVGRAVEDFIHPDCLAATMARARRLVAGEPVEYPVADRYVRVDGSTVEVEVNVAPVAYQGKRAIQVILVDVSQRRASEDRFRRVFEAANVGKSITLPNGHLTVNRAYAEMLGYTPAEMMGKTWLDITPPEDVQELQQVLRELIHPDGPGAARLERRYVDKAGRVVWADVSTVVARDEDGHPEAFFTTVVDITERKAAQEALEAKEAFIRALMDNLPIGVAVNSVHPTIEFRYMNDNFPRLYRTTRAALAAPGAFWSVVYPDPEVRGPLRERVLADLATGEARRMYWEDVPLVRPGEPTTYISACCAPVPGSDEVISLVWDVTGRHQAEAERARLEQQLLAVQRMEAVGRLAGGVAHDFNNLLSVIISYAGFVADALPASAPAYADVGEIQQAGERAAALTRQLLAFSRKQVLQPEVLNLNAVVQGMVGMLRRLLGEDIQVEMYLADGLDNVFADPGQVDQVIMNLAVNARDAMPGGGKLSIETLNVALVPGAPELPLGLHPGRFVLLALTDTGCGMDAATLPHIFEPFFTTKEKGRGTGLGLSTVYGIVKQSGGALRVETTLGEGTTFFVYLPRVEAALPERRPAPPAPVVAGGTETVLIVEDEDAVRRSAERILRAAGYRVFTADSGGNALILCERYGPSVDLLLADVVMPQMSGPELAERLTRLWPRLKVLYMSGYTDDALGHHGVLASETAFIGKPFVAGVLAAKVREVLDRGIGLVSML